MESHVVDLSKRAALNGLMDVSETPDSKGRVLVVGGEAGIRKLVSEKLLSEGFDCEACSGGEEALPLLGGWKFDAVISDLRMPGMAWTELLEETRRQQPHVAFLVVTGVEDVRVAIDAMKRGAVDYLIKLLRSDLVQASLQRALQIKRNELELGRHRQILARMVEEHRRQLQAANRRIELTYDETLEAVGAALDLRAYPTAGHSRRVTLYSLEIAKALHCSEGQLKHIARGSFLPEIGNIGIPDAILLEEGKLTPEESRVMQRHVGIGYELVRRTAFLAPSTEIVLTHRERYDGTGYPQGLAGNEIPLEARIFAVADTLDAMTSNRPYRRALPFPVARQEIVREAGRQFDPEVAETFLSIPQQVWQNRRSEVAGLRGHLQPAAADTPGRA